MLRCKFNINKTLKDMKSLLRFSKWKTETFISQEKRFKSKWTRSSGKLRENIKTRKKMENYIIISYNERRQQNVVQICLSSACCWTPKKKREEHNIKETKEKGKFTLMKQFKFLGKCFPSFSSLFCLFHFHFVFPNNGTAHIHRVRGNEPSNNDAIIWHRQEKFKFKWMCRGGLKSSLVLSEWMKNKCFPFHIFLRILFSLFSYLTCLFSSFDWILLSFDIGIHSLLRILIKLLSRCM